MKHHTKRSGCQSNAQKKRKYRHIKRETKLNIARRVDSTALQCYDTEDSLLSNSNECHALEDAVNIPEIDATNWIGSLSAIPLAFIPTAFSGMYKRCVWAVGQSFEKAKDVVFPSFKIRRELESTQLKVIQLEQSLERILQEKETKTNVTCNCCCAKSPCDSTLNSSSTSTKSTYPSTNPTALPIPPSFAPPAPSFAPPTPSIVPPPPGVAPPPPPPPPPPVKEVKEFKLVINKAKKRDRETTKKDENGFHISANDLRKVKLRKVNSYERKKTPESEFTGRMGRPLVSLNDLQKVKLRRLSLGSNLSPKSQIVLRKRLPQEAVAFRGSLKKVEIARSPGGTPYRKQVQDSGTGLTPLMARALKRKFKKAKTPSPIPMNKLTSPSSPVPVKPLRL